MNHKGTKNTKKIFKMIRNCRGAMDCAQIAST
jgi:hypothetical protein